MERECRGLDGARARGDLGDGGGTVDRGHMRSTLHLDVDRDGGNNTERRRRDVDWDGGSNPDAGGAARHAWQGDGSAPGRNRGSVDEDRRRHGGDVYQDVEDDAMMRNNSTTPQTAWKGLESNDINHVWNHGRKFEGGFHCRYCNLQNRGGGATRFNEHLGKIVGEVRECSKVPRNVEDIMKKEVLEMRKNKREKKNHKLRLERELMDEMYRRNGVINIEDDNDEEIHMSLRESLRDRNVSRAVERRRGSGSVPEDGGYAK